MGKLVLLFFILPVFSLGQEVNFNFEDQDLTDWYQSSDDHWTVTAENPIDGSFSLMHSFDNDDAGTDWIAVFHLPIALPDVETIWQFAFRYDYNPSSNNTWAIVLGTDCMPGESLQVENGLILGVNYEGNDDIIKLWGSTGGEISTILNSGFNWEEHNLRKQAVDFKLSVSPEQVISIEIDTSGEGFVLLTKGELKWSDRINNFGILYKYTSSYDRGLIIDNIAISGKLEQDNRNPDIEKISVLNPERIIVQFSELVKTTAGSEWCVTGIGCNFSDVFVCRNMQFELPAFLIPGNHYSLKLDNIFDLYGNRLYDTIDHAFYYPAAYDVVINEIMADPEPPVLLPGIEYIELYNRSEEDISMENWQLSINNITTLIPPIDLQSGGYVALCNEKDTGFITNDIQFVPLHSMGAINNSETKILLQDVSGKLIHAVQYNNNWIEDLSKREGGWSVEMIDPENPCDCRTNWIASIDARGGTPGEKNSVYSPRKLLSNPELWRVAITDSASLTAYFSEPLDSLRSSANSYFSVDQSIGSPEIVELSWPFAEKMKLIFSDNFELGKEYVLSITRDPSDCGGDPFIEVKNNIFRLSQEYDSSDLIINEVMFDPKDDCIEYIELYNRSENTIELKDWQLQVGDRSVNTLTTEYFPLLPGNFAIIASDLKGIDNPDRFNNPQQIIEVPDLPPLSNDGDLIKLIDSEGNGIDMALFDPSWHHELISDTQGKSLERISSLASGLDRNNWRSASSTAGYQTPGARNSQSEQSEHVNQLTVIPETITPNADGVDDELNICYRLDGSDYMTRVLIFDISGRLRRTIANGSLPGTEGCYLFDGKGQNGSMLPTGYYILYFEAYDPYGKRFQKKTSFLTVVDK